MKENICANESENELKPSFSFFVGDKKKNILQLAVLIFYLALCQ